LPLEAFRGVICTDAEVTREMHEESRLVSRIYAVNVLTMMDIWARYRQTVDRALAAVDAVKDDPKARKELIFKRIQAQSALHFYEERQRQELKNLINFVRKWAQRKNGDRLGYLQAMHEIACRGKGTGSIVFYAFPQELVNQIIDRTGGRPVTVAVPDLCDGAVEIDSEGRIFLVDQVTSDGEHLCERQTFLMQVTQDGQVLMDYGRNGELVRRERIQPFRVQPGRSEVRNGQVVFPDTQQRPHVPAPKVERH
jgi:hypothetical protein